MKVRLLALVLTLVFSGASAIAAPNPKTGAPCTKSGLVKTYQEKKFTCISSGKKLVWSKGVSTKTTSTPSPSPTPALTLAQKWVATGSKALEGFNQAFPQKSAQYPTLETVWRVSEQVNPRVSMEIQRQYKESIDFWSAYTKHEGVLQVIVGTLDDIEFVCRWRNSFLDMPGPNCTSSFRTDKSRLWDAHTTQSSSKATDFYFMTDPAALMEADFLPRVPHEFFHNVQWAQTVRYKSLLPCWAEEGGAEYFGILISSQGDLEEFLKRRSQELRDRRGKLMRTQLTQADWKEWLNSADMNSIIPASSEWGCQNVQQEGIYSYGLLATEYLNMKLGTAGLLALYKDSEALGWNKAIEKALGKSKSEAYDDIAAYMREEYRINLSQRIINR
jgi:hypothetical protein